MTTMKQTTEVCGLCNTLNHRMILTSYNTFGGRDTELRSFAIGFDPLSLAVHSCWKCGYTAYRITEGVTEEIRPQLERLLLDLGAGKISGGDNVYVRMALLAELRREGDEMEGELWLRAAWVEEDANRKEEASAYRANAAGRLAAVLNGGCATSDIADFGMKLLRMGEICRRMGDFGQSEAWHIRAEKEELPEEIRRILPTLHLLVKQKDVRQWMCPKNGTPSKVI